MSAAPLAMVLYCPACGLQHIDEATATWPNPPHRSHLCQGCGHIWRPADVPTTGVLAIETRGVDDCLSGCGCALLDLLAKPPPSPPPPPQRPSTPEPMPLVQKLAMVACLAFLVAIGVVAKLYGF